MTIPTTYKVSLTEQTANQSVLEFVFDNSLFAQFAESGVNAGSGEIRLEITKHASMLEITATIVGQVNIECDRCADIYSQPIDVNGSVIIKISEQRGEYDGDIIWVDPREESVDLTQWIYESIVLSLPLQRVHTQRDECNAEALKYIISE